MSVLNSPWFRAWYIIVTSLCIAGSMHYPWHELHVWTKPLIMASLIIALLIDQIREGGIILWLLIAALLLSLCGDVLLIEKDDMRFQLGLGSFLLAHVLYAIAFLKVPKRPAEVPNLKRHPWLIFSIGGYAAWFFSKIKPGLGDLALPVLCYIVVICLMVLLSFNRRGAVSTRSFRWVWIGAILFAISDSILAWNMFKSAIDIAPILIMSSYAGAQYCISKGLVEQHN